MIDPILLTGILKEYLQSKKFWVVVSALFTLCVFLFFGSVHIVNGSRYHGSPFVDKLSFGFSETFINADQIAAMPYIVVKAQFPLSVLALQRAGYLETDQERDIRVETEHKAAMSRIQANIEVENKATIVRAQAESEKQIRKTQDDMRAALEGLAALVKAAEEPTATVFNGNVIRLEGASFEIVKENVGNHPGQLMWKDSFVVQLKAGLGTDYLDVKSGLSGPSSNFIKRQGDYYFGDACMAHDCPGQEAAIAIHTTTGEVVVGLRIEKKVKVFGAVDASHLPAPIKTWLAALQY